MKTIKNSIRKTLAALLAVIMLALAAVNIIGMAEKDNSPKAAVTLQSNTTNKKERKIAGPKKHLDKEILKVIEAQKKREQRKKEEAAKQKAAEEAAAKEKQEQAE